MPDTNQPETITSSEPTISEETPISPNTPESIPLADSQPSDTPPEPLEASTSNADTPQANIDNPASVSPESQPPEPENPDSTEIIPEPSNTTETGTAQMPENESFVTERNPSFLRNLLTKAQESIQFRKRKKLDRIMSLFETKQKITNDEVEKLLHVSDATATRYLNILEQENKIKQEGKTGHSVFYSKI